MALKMCFAQKGNKSEKLHIVLSLNSHSDENTHCIKTEKDA